MTRIGLNLTKLFIIKVKLSRTLDAFALSVYDAVWLVALAYFAVEDPKDAESFKAAFLDTANAYTCITGPAA